MKKQLVTIGGGDSFSSYKKYLSYLKEKEFYLERGKIWREDLPKDLGPGFEVMHVSMPNRENAKYKEWEIWFNKLVPHLRDNVMILGHSLGGIFLAKYLAKNRFPKKIRAIFLMASPFKEHGKDDDLGDFKLPKDLSLINQAEHIFLYQSKDDFIVPYKDVFGYKKALPKAELCFFLNKGHFIQKRFPEFIKNVKRVANEK